MYVVTVDHGSVICLHLPSYLHMSIQDLRLQ